MQILKKGSKGKEVETVQALMNKAGAKPKLKVDGIFGPLTDQQTRSLQKKFNTKPDGKIGEITMASLKHGGPLPVLPEIAHNDMVSAYAKGGYFGAGYAKAVVSADKDFSALVKIATKNFALVRDMNQKSNAIKDQMVEVAKNILSKTAEFEKQRLKSPATAEKLAKEIGKLEDKWHSLNLSDRFENVRPLMKKILTDMDSVRKAISDLA